jgi:hypothetical protein
VLALAASRPLLNGSNNECIVKLVVNLMRTEAYWRPSDNSS